MPNTKISNLTSAGTLTGSEVAPIVQSGSTVKATAQNIANLAIPSQTGQSGKYLTTNGTTTSWGTVSGGGPVFIGSIFPLGGGTIFINTTYSTFVNPVAVTQTTTEWRIQCNSFNGQEIIELGNFFGNLAVAPFTALTAFTCYNTYNAGSKYHSFFLYNVNANQLSPLANYAAGITLQLNIYQG